MQKPPTEARLGWVQFTPSENTVAEFDIRIRLPRTEIERQQLKTALASVAWCTEIRHAEVKEGSDD